MRLLLLADIHIGSIKDTKYVYDNMIDLIDKEIMFTQTDVVVILGDYFHRLFKVNEEYVSLAINVMSYLIRACKKCKTKIRIVYGTESHEMNQYKLFNYHITSTHIDLKIFDTVSEENINGVNILYIPEEYIDNKKKHYKNYLYSDKHYDYIFGHGVIEDGMPAIVSYASENKSNNEKQVPRFKSGELAAVSNICVFGHYHCYTDMGNNVYYLGSLFRDSFGEESPKGYGVIEDDKFTFIENKNAYVYKTYEFNEDSDIYLSADNIMGIIDQIKQENEGIFNGEQIGKIRIVFKVPNTADPTFKENLKTLLFNDKIISPIIKESNEDLLSEVRDEISDEFDFILDNSLSINDKIFQYINKKYDNPMSLDALISYINDPLKI